jgi:hypothetical protein
MIIKRNIKRPSFLPYSEMLTNILKREGEYKIWFGVMDRETQQKILNVLYDHGCSWDCDDYLVERDISFDTLYIGSYRGYRYHSISYMGMGNYDREIEQERIDYHLRYYNNHEAQEIDKDIIMNLI